jgi:hypothetical protein
MTVVWSIREPLTAPQKTVLLRLADFARNDGSSVFPGIARIAADCRLSRRAVIQALKRLEEMEFVKTLRRGAGTQTSRRQLDVARLSAAAGSAPRALSNSARGAPDPSGVIRQLRKTRDVIKISGSTAVS